MRRATSAPVMPDSTGTWLYLPKADRNFICAQRPMSRPGSITNRMYFVSQNIINFSSCNLDSALGISFNRRHCLAIIEAGNPPGRNSRTYNHREIPVLELHHVEAVNLNLQAVGGCQSGRVFGRQHEDEWRRVRQKIPGQAHVAEDDPVRADAADFPDEARLGV